jgi:hypothetical protein
MYDLIIKNAKLKDKDNTVDEIDALRRLSAVRLVISNGNVIAKTEPSKTYVNIDNHTEHITFQK